MILNLKFYDASDFEIKFLRRVRFWIKVFTTRQISKKKKYLKKMFFKKNKFLKSTILKKKKYF